MNASYWLLIFLVGSFSIANPEAVQVLLMGWLCVFLNRISR